MKILIAVFLATFIGQADALTPSVQPSVLALPRVVYAAVGIEANIYFSSVILAPPVRTLLIKVTSPRGKQQSERWVYTPEAKDVGEFPLAIEVRDSNDRIVASGTTTVLVAAPSRLAGSDISLLAIGDSLTEAGIYTAGLLQLFAHEGSSSFTLLGTHHSGGPEGNWHEGYSGWKFEDFLTRFDPAADAAGGRKGSSPFIFIQDNKAIFDLPRYFREKTSGRRPTAITVFLGTNDVFTATDQNRAAVVQQILTSARDLLAQLRKAAPKAKIGVIAPVAPADQNAFGENYGTEFDHWNYRKNQDALLRGLMESFSNRETEGVYFVPAYLNFEAEGDYPSTTGPRNSRNAEPVSRQSNALHPAEAGYLHVADTIFAWLANFL